MSVCNEYMGFLEADRLSSYPQQDRGEEVCFEKELYVCGRGQPISLSLRESVSHCWASVSHVGPG